MMPGLIVTIPVIDINRGGLLVIHALHRLRLVIDRRRRLIIGLRLIILLRLSRIILLWRRRCIHRAGIGDDGTDYNRSQDACRQCCAVIVSTMMVAAFCKRRGRYGCGQYAGDQNCGE